MPVSVLVSASLRSISNAIRPFRHVSTAPEYLSPTSARSELRLRSQPSFLNATGDPRRLIYRRLNTHDTYKRPPERDFNQHKAEAVDVESLAIR